MLRVSLCFLSKKIERRMMDEAIFWKIGGGDGENVVYSERLNFEEKKGKYIFRHHFCENIWTEKKYFIDRYWIIMLTWPSCYYFIIEINIVIPMSDYIIIILFLIFVPCYCKLIINQYFFISRIFPERDGTPKAYPSTTTNHQTTLLFQESKFLHDSLSQ